MSADAALGMTRAPKWQHHLPTALHAIVAATAERHRHGQVSTATVAIMAAELEHAAIWYAHQPGAVTITITDLAETSARLAEIANTGDPA